VNRLDPLLSVRSAAEPLGIAPRTLRDLIARGEVEAVRIGGAIRIRRSTVRALIQMGTSGTPNVSPPEAR